jgi:hypothetical protein
MTNSDFCNIITFPFLSFQVIHSIRYLCRLILHMHRTASTLHSMPITNLCVKDIGLTHKVSKIGMTAR